jgi:hypothetical protein
MNLESITTSDHGEGFQQRKVAKFAARYDTSIPEDQRFQKATPWGTIEMQIDNPAALEQLKPGKSYYVDFTPVPEMEKPAA